MSDSLSQDEVELARRLRADFPGLKFREGKKFAFRPPRTVILGPSEPSWGLLALHEVSHAALGHRTFKLDVERLKMEMDAWEKAKKLAPAYGVEVDDELIQTELDTYRDWLHQKSRCPKCGLTRFQTDKGYRCPICDS